MYVGVYAPIYEKLIYVKTTKKYPNNSFVIIETKNGSYIAKTTLNYTTNEQLLNLGDAQIIRLAEVEDLASIDYDYINKLNQIFINTSKQLSLPLEYLGVWTSVEQNYVKFYYYSEQKFEFKELIQKLLQRCRSYHLKIELVSLGSREQVCSCGAIGVCGRITCCNSVYNAPKIITPKLLNTYNIKANELLLGLCNKIKCCTLEEGNK